ncbi:hypothetical protein GALMADRAFT_57639 [Galerina marginata CBS 339.88]|uniref:ABM domain-containing protein n=1 Tax=Galerina marginata (strain CBS 339.88) TaxID=685588 RepID=A0A067TKQ6_GALM3|nr:hypothetical protein GALMADRAFT_57639 [Galerina marginata CBS 339.88]
MPILEIGFFPASEALLANNEITQAELEFVAKSEGCISVYYGIDVDGNKTAFMGAIWESFDHYKKVVESPEFPATMEALKPAMAGPLTSLHVECEADPTSALEAPVTEITLAKLKDGKTHEELKPLADAICDNAHLAKGAHPPVAWGPFIQKPGEYGVAVGWDSVEDHIKLADNPPYDKFLPSLFEMADMTVNHVKFKKLVF